MSIRLAFIAATVFLNAFPESWVLPWFSSRAAPPDPFFGSPSVPLVAPETSHSEYGTSEFVGYLHHEFLDEYQLGSASVLVYTPRVETESRFTSRQWGDSISETIPKAVSSFPIVSPIRIFRRETPPSSC